MSSVSTPEPLRVASSTSTVIDSIAPIVPEFPSDWPPPAMPFKLDALPRLPAIQDPDIAAQAKAQPTDLLTGRWTTAQACYDAELRSNRRLEWMGDIQLDYLVSKRLVEQFPRLLNSGLTQLREKIVSNTTLCRLTKCYRLDASLSKASLPHFKVYANLIEAHIGGVCASDRSGWTLLEEWVASLLSPEVMPELAKLAEQFEATSLTLKGKNGIQKRRKVESSNVSAKRVKTDPLARKCACGSHLLDVQVPETKQGWVDVEILGDGWHSSLAVRGKLESCGSGKTLAQARDSAVSAYFR